MAPAAGAAVTLPPLAASQADAGMMGGRGALPMAGPPAAALPSSTWMGAPPAPPSHFHDLAPPHRHAHNPAAHELRALYLVSVSSQIGRRRRLISQRN